MKRILPLILALVAGMAQADSNSDYRAGSDFARQIQGQGNRYSGKCIIVCIRRFFLPELPLYLHEYNL